MKIYSIISFAVMSIFLCSCNNRMVGEYDYIKGSLYSVTTVKVGENKKMSIIGSSCTNGKVLRGYYKKGIGGIKLKTIDSDESKIIVPYFEVVRKRKLGTNSVQFEFQIYDNTTWFHIPTARIIGEKVTADSNEFKRILNLEYKGGVTPKEIKFIGDGYKEYNIIFSEHFELGYKYEIDIFLDFEGLEGFLKLKKGNNVRVKIKYLGRDRIELIEKYGHPIFSEKMKRELERMR